MFSIVEKTNLACDFLTVSVLHWCFAGLSEQIRRFRFSDSQVRHRHGLKKISEIIQTQVDRLQLTSVQVQDHGILGNADQRLSPSVGFSAADNVCRSCGNNDGRCCGHYVLFSPLLRHLYLGASELCDAQHSTLNSFAASFFLFSACTCTLALTCVRSFSFARNAQTAG
jgi:hypothetical protein